MLRSAPASVTLVGARRVPLASHAESAAENVPSNSAAGVVQVTVIAAAEKVPPNGATAVGEPGATSLSDASRDTGVSLLEPLRTRSVPAVLPSALNATSSPWKVVDDMLSLPMARVPLRAQVW